MAKTTALDLIKRLNTQARASGAAGLPLEVEASLDSLPWDATQSWIKRLNAMIPASEKQLSMLFGLLGGLEEVPVGLEGKLRSLTQLQASEHIEALKLHPGQGHILKKVWRDQERAQLAPNITPAPVSEKVAEIIPLRRPEPVPVLVNDEPPADLDLLDGIAL